LFASSDQAYVYAGGDPVGNNDPTGLACSTIEWFLVTGICAIDTLYNDASALLAHAFSSVSSKDSEAGGCADSRCSASANVEGFEKVGFSFTLNTGDQYQAYWYKYEARVTWFNTNNRWNSQNFGSQGLMNGTSHEAEVEIGPNGVTNLIAVEVMWAMTIGNWGSWATAGGEWASWFILSFPPGTRRI
jgi:hypothetical protein